MSKVWFGAQPQSNVNHDFPVPLRQTIPFIIPDALIEDQSQAYSNCIGQVTMESRPRGQRGHRRFSVRFRHVERGRKWGIRVPKTALEEGLSKWRLGDNEHNNGRQKQKEETGRLPLVSVSGNTFLDPFQTYPSSVAAATAGQIVRHGE
jgi:hypothetical protein